MAGHIINDFKDLRSLIGEVTKANPAKTTYQQNAEKMGYVHESKTAGADLIRKAYIKIGRAAQGPIKKQMKMVAKELEKMGYKTYDPIAMKKMFESLKMKEAFNYSDKDFDAQIKAYKYKSGVKFSQVMKDFEDDWDSAFGNRGFDYDSVEDGLKRSLKKSKIKFKEENTQLESALSDMRNIVKTKGARKINGIMIDMFTASVITRAYDKVNDANKKKMEGANLQQLVKLAHKIMGMKEELNLDESKLGDLLIDIQQGATAKELARDHNITLAAAKNFLSDYYGNKRTRKAPGLKKENIDEGKMKDIFIDFEDGVPDMKIAKSYGVDIKVIKGLKKDWLGIQKKHQQQLAAQNEEALHEGTWAVPDSYKKLYNLQVGFLSNKKAATELNSRKLLVDLYPIFGDDSLYDDVGEYIDNPDPKFDLRDLIVKHLKRFGLKFSSSYKITHAPEEWIDNLEKSESKIEERLIEGKPRRGRGNIKKPRGKIVVFKMSREDKLKEQREHAQQVPFKLKSQQYPRAIAINTDGFGKRHATVDDILKACDSFGMILDKELQVEQVQKELGKNGFISFKQSDLNDVFDERETERMILALESTVEEQEPIEYTKEEIQERYDSQQEIEFLKPDGYKTTGPILKVSGNTFNVKDKFTGKSYTYKYFNEEEEVKTFKELTEGKFSPTLVKKAVKIAKDMGGNMTGAYKKIEKIKKGLGDDPTVSNALRLANEDVTEWVSKDGVRRRVKGEDKRIKEWEKAAEATGDKAAYQKFFKSALKKFGVSSPDELEGDKEKEFYNYVDKNWKADHEEEVSPSELRIDGRRKNFKEKMRKLGYIKASY